MSGNSSLPSQELQDALLAADNGVGNIGLRVSSQLQDILIETGVYGAFSLLIIQSTVILLRNGLKQKSRIVIAVVCIVMYAMATAHWVLTLREIFADNAGSLALQSATSDCLENLSEGEACMLTLQDVFNFLGPEGSSCETTSLLIVNILLSDAIVLWRAWVLWSRRRILTTISVVLLLTTLALSAVNVHNTCKMDLGLGNEFVDDVFGFAALLFSWITNLWATALISYKAWQHRRLVKRNLNGKSVGSRTGKYLMLFVDSGIIYCVLWTCLVIDPIIQLFIRAKPSFLIGTLQWRFTVAMETLFSTCLIDLIGMYPTILVVLVSLTRSDLEHTIKENDTSTVIPQIRYSTYIHGPRLALREQFTETEDDTVDGASASDAVIILGELRQRNEEAELSGLGNSDKRFG